MPIGVVFLRTRPCAIKDKQLICLQFITSSSGRRMHTDFVVQESETHCHVADSPPFAPRSAAASAPAAAQHETLLNGLQPSHLANPCCSSSRRPRSWTCTRALRHARPGAPNTLPDLPQESTHIRGALLSLCRCQVRGCCGHVARVMQPLPAAGRAQLRRPDGHVHVRDARAMVFLLPGT